MIAVLSWIDLAGIAMVCGVILTALVVGKHLTASIGRVQVSVDDGAAHAATAALRAEEAVSEAKAINEAVNNHPPPAPKLYEMMRAQGFQLDDNTALGHATARHLEELAANLHVLTTLFTAHIEQGEAGDDRIS